MSLPNLLLGAVLREEFSDRVACAGQRPERRSCSQVCNQIWFLCVIRERNVDDLFKDHYRNYQHPVRICEYYVTRLYRRTAHGDGDVDTTGVNSV